MNGRSERPLNVVTVQESLSILIADDDEDERMFLLSAFKEIGIPSLDVLHFEENGELLLGYLKLLLPHQYPSLIVLDVNMPLMGGPETLKVLKSDNSYKDIPVMMFSTVRSEADAQKYIKLGAVSFDEKSNTHTGVITLARKFFDYASHTFSYNAQSH